MSGTTCSSMSANETRELNLNSHFSFFLPFFFTSVFFLDKVFFFMKFGNWIIIFLWSFFWSKKKKQKRIKQLTNLWIPKSWICCGYEFIGIKNRFLPLGVSFKWINSEIMKTNDILNANAKCFKTFFLSLRFENDSNLA